MKSVPQGFGKAVFATSLVCIAWFGFLVLAIIAGWNDWFSFGNEEVVDNTVFAVTRNGVVVCVEFSSPNSRVVVPDPIWSTAKIKLASEIDSVDLAKLKPSMVRDFGFEEQSSDKSQAFEIYGNGATQFEFDSGRLSSCTICADSSIRMLVALREDSEFFSLPISKENFDRLRKGSEK